MSLVLDLWYLHRESLLYAAGAALLAAAALLVLVGASEPSVTVAGDIFRNFALPVIGAAVLTYAVRRWYWLDEDASWRELTPEGVAVAGALSVCMALFLGTPVSGSSATSLPAPAAPPATASAPAAYAAPGEPTETQALSAPGFTAAYPRGWSEETTERPHDMTRWSMSSGSPVNGVGIAGPDDLALSVYVFPFDSISHPPDESDLYELLSRVVGTPEAAQNLRPTRAKYLTLGGQEAISVAFAYDYKGRSIIQNDVVAVHDDQVYFIELNRDSSMASEGTNVMHLFLRTWQWSLPGAGFES